MRPGGVRVFDVSGCNGGATCAPRDHGTFSTTSAEASPAVVDRGASTSVGAARSWPRPGTHSWVRVRRRRVRSCGPARRWSGGPAPRPPTSCTPDAVAVAGGPGLRARPRSTRWPRSTSTRARDHDRRAGARSGPRARRASLACERASLGLERHRVRRRVRREAARHRGGSSHPLEAQTSAMPATRRRISRRGGQLVVNGDRSRPGVRRRQRSAASLPHRRPEGVHAAAGPARRTRSGYVVSGSPAVANGALYTVTPGANFRALDAATSVRLWMANTGRGRAAARRRRSWTERCTGTRTPSAHDLGLRGPPDRAGSTHGSTRLRAATGWNREGVAVGEDAAGGPREVGAEEQGAGPGRDSIRWRVARAASASASPISAHSGTAHWSGWWKKSPVSSAVSPVGLDPQRDVARGVPAVGSSRSPPPRSGSSADDVGQSGVEDRLRSTARRRPRVGAAGVARRTRARPRCRGGGRW